MNNSDRNLAAIVAFAILVGSILAVWPAFHRAAVLSDEAKRGKAVADTYCQTHQGTLESQVDEKTQTVTFACLDADGATLPLLPQ